MTNQTTRDQIITVDKYAENPNLYIGTIVNIHGKLTRYQMDSGIFRRTLKLNVTGGGYELTTGNEISRYHGEDSMIRPYLDASLGKDISLKLIPGKRFSLIEVHFPTRGFKFYN